MVRCLPTATTCPLFCERTNPIRSLYIALPTYYSTLIPPPHHGSATCSFPSLCLLPTSHRPSAISPHTHARPPALAVNFNPTKPSTQLQLVDTQNTPPVPSTILCIVTSSTSTLLLFQHSPPPRVRQRTSSLVLVSCISAVCTLPLAPAETARDETVPAWKPSLSARSHHLLYTCIHYLATPRQHIPRRFPIPYAIVNHGHKCKLA